MMQRYFKWEQSSLREIIERPLDNVDNLQDKKNELVLCLQAAVRLLTVSVRLHHIVSAGVHFSLGLKKINNMLNLRIKNEIQYRA